jgi:hypothetical protein
MAGFSYEYIWVSFVMCGEISTQQVIIDPESFNYYLVFDPDLFNSTVLKGGEQPLPGEVLCKSTTGTPRSCFPSGYSKVEQCYAFLRHRTFTIDSTNEQSYGIMNIDGSELKKSHKNGLILIVVMNNNCEYWMGVNHGDTDPDPSDKIIVKEYSILCQSGSGVKRGVKRSQNDSVQAPSTPPTKQQKQGGGKKHTQNKNKILKRKSYRNRRRTKKAKRSKTRKIYKK